MKPPAARRMVTSGDPGSVRNKSSRGPAGRERRARRAAAAGAAGPPAAPPSRGRRPRASCRRRPPPAPLALPTPPPAPPRGPWPHPPLDRAGAGAQPARHPTPGLDPRPARPGSSVPPPRPTPPTPLRHKRSNGVLAPHHGLRQVWPAGSPQCCIRHSEAFSRVRLARCGGSRQVKLGDIRKAGVVLVLVLCLCHLFMYWRRPCTAVSHCTDDSQL